jgi:endonuclease/exonuclease/phosphatase family metal-dependent hydrolase
MSNSKIVFWNVWSHRYGDTVHTFLNQHSDADIFCLTEVTDVKAAEIEKYGHNLVFSGDEAAAQVNGLALLTHRFGDTHSVFYKTADYREWKCVNTGARFKKVGFGSALVVRKGITIVDTGHVIVDFTDTELKSRVIQWIVYVKHGVRYLVLHLHGVWIRGNTKGDHAARFHQSTVLREVLATLRTELSVEKVVFGGDFNLDQSTYALYLLENGAEGMSGERYRNLITEYAITDTRTKLYRSYANEDATLYADYVLVSDAVVVDSFSVHNEVLASDHAALVVEFS